MVGSKAASGSDHLISLWSKAPPKMEAPPQSEAMGNVQGTTHALEAHDRKKGSANVRANKPRIPMPAADADAALRAAQMVRTPLNRVLRCGTLLPVTCLLLHLRNACASCSCSKVSAFRRIVHIVLCVAAADAMTRRLMRAAAKRMTSILPAEVRFSHSM